jgi:hypothetical protein
VADAALTMSLSPSFPQGAPTLAEVLLQRTFAKPPQPFADGELLQALAHTKDAAPSPDAVAKPKPSGSSASDRGPGSASGDDASAASSDADGSGATIDVRA